VARRELKETFSLFFYIKNLSTKSRMKMNEIQMHHWPGLLLRKERKIIHKSPPSPPCARGKKERKSNLDKKMKSKKVQIPASG